MSDIPEICSQESNVNQKYLFKSEVFEIIFIVLIIVAYCVPATVIYLKWHDPDLRPRSPVLILFLLGFLLLDLVGNTVLFSINPDKKPKLVCWLGIFITVICEFGIMLVLYLRMYRINKVFTEYETYLEAQKEAMLLSSSVSPKLSKSSISDKSFEIKSPVLDSW